MKFVSFFETGQGRGAVMATDRGVSKVYLPETDGRDLPTQLIHGDFNASELTDQVAQMLMYYFKGIAQQFDSIALDYTVSGVFRRRVLELVRSIPFGQIKSYGEVAVAAGKPGAARAVGGAMASNPVPIIIPCHRVIAVNGKLTGYSASGGLALKKYILKLEGVEFKGDLAVLL